MSAVISACAKETGGWGPGGEGRHGAGSRGNNKKMGGVGGTKGKSKVIEKGRFVFLMKRRETEKKSEK